LSGKPVCPQKQRADGNEVQNVPAERLPQDEEWHGQEHRTAISIASFVSAKLPASGEITLSAHTMSILKVYPCVQTVPGSH